MFFWGLWCVHVISLTAVVPLAANADCLVVEFPCLGWWLRWKNVVGKFACFLFGFVLPRFFGGLVLLNLNLMNSERTKFAQQLPKLGGGNITTLPTQLAHQLGFRGENSCHFHHGTGEIGRKIGAPIGYHEGFQLESTKILGISHRSALDIQILKRVCPWKWWWNQARNLQTFVYFQGSPVSFREGPTPPLEVFKRYCFCGPYPASWKVKPTIGFVRPWKGALGGGHRVDSQGSICDSKECITRSPQMTVDIAS